MGWKCGTKAFATLPVCQGFTPVEGEKEPTGLSFECRHVGSSIHPFQVCLRTALDVLLGCELDQH